MTWIKSDQGLATHPKTRRLCRQLGLRLPAAVGHLQLLWWWSMDHARDGCLCRYSAADIADACDWGGEEGEDPAAFVDALVCAGFIDRDEDGTRIHDWLDYSGDLAQQRKRNAEKQKQHRERNRDVVVTSPVRRREETALDRDPDKDKDLDQQPPSDVVGDSPLADESSTANLAAAETSIAVGPERPYHALALPAVDLPLRGQATRTKRRLITAADIVQLGGEFPDVDVGAAAADYLNWAGSKKHLDEVLGLRNQLQMPFKQTQFAKKAPFEAARNITQGRDGHDSIRADYEARNGAGGHGGRGAGAAGGRTYSGGGARAGASNGGPGGGLEAGIRALEAAGVHVER